jgi:hypothetical protein
MRKKFLTISLFLALAASILAEGNTPMSGFAGCAPGLWYPESHVCVYELSAPVEITKPKQSTVMDTLAVKAFLHIRDMIF